MNVSMLNARPRGHQGRSGLAPSVRDASDSTSRWDLRRRHHDWALKEGAMPRPTADREPGASADPTARRPELSNEGLPSWSDDEFTALASPCIREVLRVARTQLGCEHLAWEAIQEALLSLWSQRAAPPNPKAWLIRAVIFRCLHLRRTIRRRHKHERQASLMRRELVDEGQPSRSILSEEARADVRAALEGLSDNHREALTLHLIEGLTYKAVARRLDIPIGTVRSRVSRARKALADRLAADFHELA